MYVNANMIPFDTVPGSGDGEWEREVELGDSSMIYFIHCKNFCKCYSVPILSTKIFKKKRKCSTLLVIKEMEIKTTRTQFYI
jgi:hypothetical protein